MHISDVRIADFVSRWQQAFGESITRDEAQLVATRLVRFYRMIVRPLPESAAGEDIGEIMDVGDVDAAMLPLGLHQETQRNSPTP
jgi:hypothetical protein